MAIMRSTINQRLTNTSPLFEKMLNLLRSYLDTNNMELQVQALYGIQRVDYELQHPKGELATVIIDLTND